LKKSIFALVFTGGFMISISVGIAKNKLPYYLHLVEEKGESIQVTRHGKTVAVINNQETSNALDKKQLFMTSLKNWRKKFYSEKLSEPQITNEEIDSIFARKKDTDPFIRHPEDFE